MSSNPSPRLVVVDDIDNDIIYHGLDSTVWFQDHGSLDQTGTNGPTYLHTSHGTKSNTSLTFPFNGTDVKVYGTTQFRDVSGIVDPTWLCYVDGVSIGSFPAVDTTNIPSDENNFLLCSSLSTLQDGAHQLTIEIVTRGSTFWIDDINYVPSPKASLDTASILVDSSDPAIIFSSGWQTLGGIANITQQNGATMQLSFIGNSISWYALIPTEFPHAPASATYSIDGGPPVNFNLSGLPPSSTTTIYNQVLFTALDLSPGPHTLLVKNQGDGSTTPLPLDYLIITNGSVPNSSGSFSSSSTSSSSTPTSLATTHASGGSKTPIGAIAGGVVGGLIFIVALFTFLFFWRRRKHRSANQADYNAQQPHPFIPGNVDAPELQTTQIPHHHPNISGQGRKQPEMEAGHSGAATATGTSPSFPTPSPSPPQNVSSNRGIGNMNDLTSSMFVVHADSGIRIPSTGAERLIDIPPHYTES